MTRPSDESTLRLAIPKGRMEQSVTRLLADAGIHLTQTVRSYRPHISIPNCEVKILKPQSIVEMLHAGSRDLGFAGADWVAELDGSLVELLDTGLDPVRVVAAAPAALLVAGRLPERPLVVASEYENLSRRWIAGRCPQAVFVRSYGATEVFPPEDADLIIDNTATGSTLEANSLQIVDELMRSSTRLYANPRALEQPARRRAIDDLVLLVRSVLEARLRVMVEVNVAPERLDAVLAVLPCMRQPTVSQLAGGAGFAVKAAVPRADLPSVIPRLKAQGGEDVVVTRLAQIVP
jgi:ATP phosphoribosyltransferase